MKREAFELGRGTSAEAASRGEPATDFGEALAALGMSARIIELFGEALRQPSGLVLIAGSGSSGLATTVSAARRILACRGGEAVSIDRLPRDAVSCQLQALEDDAPKALVLGEIGDRATASAASKAAERHLVVATVPAARAVGAIAWLRQLKVQPFHIAYGLRAVFAQRLVRRLCNTCREPAQASRATCALLGFDPGAVIYEGRGCPACGGTGYAGRIGLFEAVKLDDALRLLINGGGDEAVIASYAFRNAPDFGSAARTMVREGKIPAEEAVRICRFGAGQGLGAAIDQPSRQ